jgi:hypothetical protein
VNESALISDGWEVGTLGSLFDVLLLFNLELIDTDQVVMLERQLNGLLQCDVSWRRGRIGLLGRCKNIQECQSYNNEHPGLHDFTSFTR